MGIGESLAIRERVRILDIGNGPKSNHKKRAACKIPIYVVCRVGDTKDAGKGKSSAWFVWFIWFVDDSRPLFTEMESKGKKGKKKSRSRGYVPRV